MLRKLIGCCFLLALASAHVLASNDDAPAWLRQAASVSAPAYARDVPAVVLLDESTTRIGEDGRLTTTATYAVRILTNEGRAFAVARAGYATDSGKVRDIRAWLIRPSGQTKAYGKNDVMDAAAMNDVYDESRAKIISAEGDAETGAVFGYQTTSETRSFFNQTVWPFQERIPVIASRVTLQLPAGWSAKATTFNHTSVEPRIDGTAYTWELRNLPPIEPEPASPSTENLAPRVAISYAPLSAGNASASAKSFTNWNEVSRWYTDLSAAQFAPDAALTAKAQALTASSKTELERISAIARYVQSLQYISIQIGAGRFRPHAATEVFAKSYGDCKDKANLMRAMLKAIGIESYPVLIFSGDPTYVREEWASPTQFNHCIIAVKVSDATQTATIVQHAKLGRLLIFDATDSDTPVGDLPDHEQNSFALIAAGDSGTLMRMPATLPEANKLERQTDAVLAADGSLTATVRETSIGQAAVKERGAFRHLARPQYTKMIESWITRHADGAIISKVEPTDSPVATDNRFALAVDFASAHYAQLMNSRLLVFKPAIVSRRDSVHLTNVARHAPVVLEANSYAETARVQLPAGFDVDEMPDTVKIETPFGTYSATYETKDGKLLFTRALTVRAATVPADQYTAVRTFFERIRAAEQAPVVLAKK